MWMNCPAATAAVNLAVMHPEQADDQAEVLARRGDTLAAPPISYAET